MKYSRLAAPVSAIEEAVYLVIAALALLLVAGASETRAGTRGDSALVSLDSVEAGRLLFRTADPRLFLPAPTVGTDIEIDVSGPIARAVVRQRFHNPTSDWLEGVYVFPLPERAAVDGLRMRVGERLIEGRIAERAEARRTYETAAREGRRASLLEQERPNVFTASVANIGPNETVVIEITYQEVLAPRDGRYSLRVPLVIAPRYVPREIELVSQSGAGEGLGNSRVPDAGRVTPPVLPPEMGPANPVRIHVRLDAGMPLTEIESPYHPIVQSDGEDGAVMVRLADGPVPADRDFVLRWRPAAGALPRAAVFTETFEGEDYALVLLQPPGAEALDDAPAVPREVILVIDTSGSMAGESIRQARAALLFALASLRPSDRFNVIRFNNRTETLFPVAVPASSGNLRQARAYVAGLEAEGGTELLPALAKALSDAGETDRLRQIVLLTDAAVANEAELFAAIKLRLGESRLFAVGIGSAPNGHFLDGATRAGRGTFVHVGDVAEVDEAMQRLLAKLSTPALTDIAVRFEGGSEAEMHPDPVPDLYEGEPVVLAARLAPGTSGITVTGRRGVERWTAEVPLTDARHGAGVVKLWARKRITTIEDARLTGADPAAVKAEALAVALRHGLMTRYTSLVAVDVTAARPPDADLQRGDVPLNLPAGWEYDKVFGAPPPLPPQMRKAMLQQMTAGLQAASVPLARADSAGPVATAPTATPIAVPLPATATWSAAHLAAGLVLLLLAAAAWALARRRAA